MRRWLRTFLLVMAVFAITPAVASPAQTGFLDRAIRLNGVEYRYQIYVPRGFDSAKRWPVILALHGGGTLGTNGIQPTSGGLAEAIRRYPERFPAVVVFPHAHDDGFPTWQGPNGDMAMAALDRASAEFSGDPARTYLTGLSAGGNGAWYLAWRHPDRFAAAIMVCSWVHAFHGPTTHRNYPPIATQSGNDPWTPVAQRLSHLPVWLVHGDSDVIVNIDSSRHLFTAFKAAGADAHLTELPGVGHEAWDAAYRNPEIVAWLFTQQRR